jgi:hypothetical protein
MIQQFDAVETLADILKNARDPRLRIEAKKLFDSLRRLGM